MCFSSPTIPPPPPPPPPQPDAPQASALAISKLQSSTSKASGLDLLRIPIKQMSMVNG